MPKTVEELEAELAELQEATGKEIASLKTHNATLISEKKKEKEKRVAAEAALAAKKTGDDDDAGDDDEDDEGDEDAAILAAAKAARAKAKSSGASANETKAMVAKAVERATKKYSEELATLKATLAKAESERDDKAINSALDELIATGNVAVSQRRAVKALLRSSHKFSLVDGEILCDDEPVKDVVTEWLKGDEGKAFVAAPGNGGSAAPGGPVGQPTKKRSEMNGAEKGAYVAKHGLAAFEALPK